MTDSTLTCLDRESDFRLNELFFSTTDCRGVIRSGNDVFVRVSGYSDDELIGHAHSCIRHPDMPRGVFRLFWRMLEAGETIAAYVKNRAKDGSYYWVVAVAAPIEGGYLSVRLKPSSDLFAIVKKTYQTVLQDEHAAAREGMSKDEVAEVGLASLLEELNRLGFADYGSFQRHLLASEMMSRHEELDSGHRSLNQGSRNQAESIFTSIDALANASGRCDESLGNMLGQLSQLRESNIAFGALNGQMMRVSEEIGIAAINARGSANSPTIEAVSQELSESERVNRATMQAMDQAVQTLGEALADLSLDVFVATLQSEVTSHFLRQIQISDDDAARRLIPHVLMLATETQSRVGNLFERMKTTGEWFRGLEKLTEELHRNAKSIRFIRLAGVKESVHLPEGHAFRELFAGINQPIVDTMEHCNDPRREVQVTKRSIESLNQCKVLLAEKTETLMLHHTCLHSEVRAIASCVNLLSSST